MCDIQLPGIVRVVHGQPQNRWLLPLILPVRFLHAEFFFYGVLSSAIPTYARELSSTTFISSTTLILSTTFISSTTIISSTTSVGRLCLPTYTRGSTSLSAYLMNRCIIFFDVWPQMNEKCAHMRRGARIERRTYTTQELT